MDERIDELITRGLYDPEAPDADGVLAPLLYALDLGARFDELETSDNWRACGFPDPGDRAVFTERDVDAFRTFAAASQMFGADLTSSFARVVGSAMARVADAAVSTFAVNVGSQARLGAIDPTNPDELAAANQAAVSMLPMVVSVMDVLLRHHMEARSRDDLNLTEEGVDVLERGVGFCDLVGYTALAGELEHRDLGAVLGTFETQAADRITAAGAQVVKLIGDEVMFVATDAEGLCAAALSLTAELAEDLPPVRCGLAFGPVVLHEADYHGAVVNLAARLVKLATPGQILVSQPLRDAVGDDGRFEDAGTQTLKGFADPQRTFVLR